MATGNSVNRENSSALSETGSIKGLQANLPLAGPVLAEDKGVSPFPIFVFYSINSFCFWIAKALPSLWRDLCRPFDASGGFGLSMMFPGILGLYPAVPSAFPKSSLSLCSCSRFIAYWFSFAQPSLASTLEGSPRHVFLISFQGGLLSSLPPDSSS